MHHSVVSSVGLEMLAQVTRCAVLLGSASCAFLALRCLSQFQAEKPGYIGIVVEQKWFQTDVLDAASVCLASSVKVKAAL